jgi:putative membrane protein
MNNAWVVRWMVSTVAILCAAYLLEGIYVTGVFSAFFGAVVLAILNAFLRPLLILLTLPINILTLGLFTTIINAFILKMASGLIPGFYVQGFWTALWGALIISLVNGFMSVFITDRRSLDYIDLGARH